MRQELLDYLKQITPEEREILDGQGLRQDRYAPRGDFIVDSRMLLKKGKLIEIRPTPALSTSPSTGTTTWNWSICARAAPTILSTGKSI